MRRSSFIGSFPAICRPSIRRNAVSLALPASIRRSRIDAHVTSACEQPCTWTLWIALCRRIHYARLRSRKIRWKRFGPVLSFPPRPRSCRGPAPHHRTRHGDRDIRTSRHLVDIGPSRTGSPTTGRRPARRHRPASCEDSASQGQSRRSSPGLGREELDTLARKAWRETGRVLGEFPDLGTICGSEADERLEIVEEYDMDALRRGERQAILVSGHFANWELAAGCSRKAGFALDVIYSPQANEAVDAMIQHHREALGVGLIPRQQAARAMLRSLAKKRNFGILLDQRYDDGEPVPFFGHDTPSGIAAATLAIRQKVDYVPVRVERLKDAHFRITFHEAIEPDPEIADPRECAIDMTRRAYGLFEEWIRARPESWLCLKRRWPRKVYRALDIAI
ncbi:MAG: lysophospholipid acyltransferase family protein [Geminicoccaceae bacterium]